MKFSKFERILSQKRMKRYVDACGVDTRKAMTLYRYNLQLSQQFFSIVSMFEVALRNAIDEHLTPSLGNDWLRDSVVPGGMFTTPMLHKTFGHVNFVYQKLMSESAYSHSKMVSELDFGVWKYMFSPVQYRLTGNNLINIFPNKQRSTAQAQYNRAYIFNELDRINMLRNRIAHHEPICFPNHRAVIYTDYVRREYQKIQTLFQWMGIDSKDLLYGLDHIESVCKKIDSIK